MKWAKKSDNALVDNENNLLSLQVFVMHLLFSNTHLNVVILSLLFIDFAFVDKMTRLILILTSLTLMRIASQRPSEETQSKRYPNKWYCLFFVYCFPSFCQSIYPFFPSLRNSNQFWPCRSTELKSLK